MLFALLHLPSLTLRELLLITSALAGLPDRGVAIALEASCTELGLTRAAATTRAAYLQP